MARPCACQSRRLNPPPDNKDKLAGAASEAPTNDSGTPFHTPVMSYVPTLAPALLFALAKLVAKYTNADLQRATKLALKLFIQG